MPFPTCFLVFLVRTNDLGDIYLGDDRGPPRRGLGRAAEAKWNSLLCLMRVLSGRRARGDARRSITRAFSRTFSMFGSDAVSCTPCGLILTPSDSSGADTIITSTKLRNNNNFLVEILHYEIWDRKIYQREEMISVRLAVSVSCHGDILAPATVFVKLAQSSLG